MNYWRTLIQGITGFEFEKKRKFKKTEFKLAATNCNEIHI